MTKCRIALMMSSGLAAIFASAPAFAAQEVAAEAQATAVAASAEEGEVIVVTAQKRTQVLIDVPQSVTVVSGDTLEHMQATNFQDYLKLVPGMQLDQSNPGEGRLIVRGLNSGGVASTVATYLDETPFGSSTGLVNGGVLAGDFDTFDVARIEVLRGPQGTLYGASSLGGLLKFVTNDPNTTRVEARGRVTLEDTKGGDIGYRAQAMVNVPLSDTIAFRASGSYRKDGGFVDSPGASFPTLIGTTITSDDKNNINGVKSYGGRASLLFKPSDVFDVRLSANLQNIRTKAYTMVESDPETLESLYDGPTLNRFADPFGDLDYRVYNGLINYDLGFGTLTSSTSFSKQNQTRRQDLTVNLSWLIESIVDVPNELVLDQNTNDKRFTQEIRLASHEDDRFEWLVGGYYTHEKGLIFQEYNTLEPGTDNLITTPLGVLAQVSLDSKYKEIAGFANATVHFGEKFHLDFGGRYSHNSQDAAQTGTGALVGGPPIITDLHSSDNVFTFSVAPRYEFNDHTSVYARIAKGYRPGGPNVVAPGDAAAGAPTSFDPDTSINYELGFKAETADRQFSVDAAVYHIDWKNIQVVGTINNFTLNINGGDAKVDGVEFTGTWRPLKGLNTSINFAYTNARLADDLPPVLGQISGHDGDRLPMTPKFSIGLNGDYSWSLGDTTEAYVGASLRSLTNQIADYDFAFFQTHGEHRKIDGYSVFDLRGGVEFGKFSVEAYAKNLFDGDGKTSTVGPNANGVPIFPNGALGTGVIRPRTIGISLTAGL